MARRQGATEQQLTALQAGAYDDMEPAWGSAFEFADVLTPTPGHVPDATFEHLAAHWNPAQIVEIVSVICLFNYFNRFALALAIPITR